MFKGPGEVDHVALYIGGGMQIAATHTGRVVVNGVVAPKLVTAAGALERWRVLNASPSRYYRIAVEGHTLHQIGTDGGRLGAPVEHAELLVAPGDPPRHHRRMGCSELVVDGPPIPPSCLVVPSTR